MAIITWPTGARIKTIQWTLDRPATVNRSAWTGRRQVVANPWHGKWSAKVDLAPILGEANVLQWRAFLAQLRGQINTFRLPMTEGGQSAAFTPTIVGSSTAAGATTMLLGTGGPVPGLAGGNFVAVNDQPLLLTGAPTLDVGTGGYNINFEPSLRAAAASSAAVETRNPTCLVALTDSSIGWSVEPGKIYGISLQVEEAF